MNDIISKAFADLVIDSEELEKSKKGEKKVGNPRYRKMLKDGKTVYVLVNSDEHPSATPKLTEKEFNTKSNLGGVDLQDVHEPVVIRDAKQLAEIDWITEENKEVIKRCLQRSAFYDKSIKFAQSTGRTDVVAGHAASKARELNIIDTIVERAQRGKDGSGFSDHTIETLKSMGVSIENRVEDNSIDYINNVYPHFNFIKLTTGIQEAIEKQKVKLDNLGIPPESYNPKISMSFTPSGFVVNLNQDSNVVVDKAGYKCELYTKMQRKFSGSTEKQVYHAVFVLGKKGTTADNEQNPLRQGIAKDIMKSFYEQYVNAGIDKINVNAADSNYGGSPYCGSNTWGKWGFKIDSRSAKELIENVKEQFTQPKKMMVDEFMIEHDDKTDVCKFKKNENGAISKTTFVTGDKENGDSVKIVTKEGSDGKWLSKVRIFKVIKPEDVTLLEEVFKAESEKNPGDFRMKTWYDNMDNPTLRGLLQNHGWAGQVDLKDEKNKRDFEKNLYKRYEKVTTADIEELN